MTPSPNVGPEPNNLRAVAGVAANDLWAVGFYYVGGLRQTYILHWDGLAWTQTPSPNPGIDHTLQGMVAVAANDVWAVGAYQDNSSVNRTLILHWNGSVWSTASSANVVANSNFLTGITAVAANDLWTVGGYNNGVEQTLVERYAPCPATATPTPGTPAPTHTLTPIPTPTTIPSSPTPVATECVPSWTVEASPNVGSSDNQLRAVAAIATDDIWAVGYSGDNTVGFQSLTMHWDGHTWSVVPSPNPSAYLNFLDGVTAIASDDVWAVGNERFATFEGHTLIMHWDGSTWSVIPSPNADQGIYNYLNGVSATSANDVWEVGFYETLFDNLTLTMHWDGSAWSLVPSPNTNPTYNYLYAVEAISANDVWAVGFFTTTADHSLALHWDGSAWDVVAVPNMGSADNHLYAVNAIAPDDIWAVGLFVEYGGPSRLEHSLTTHWDGSNWSVVPSPDVGTQTNTLNGVAALATDDVWAVGIYNSSGDRSLTEHWDGTAWSVVSSPNVGGRTWLLGVAALAADNVWSVGPHDNLYRTLTEHYRSPVGCPCPLSPAPPPARPPQQRPSPPRSPPARPPSQRLARPRWRPPRPPSALLVYGRAARQHLLPLHPVPGLPGDRLGLSRWHVPPRL